jgi:hypothetical protein
MIPDHNVIVKNVRTEPIIPAPIPAKIEQSTYHGLSVLLNLSSSVIRVMLLASRGIAIAKHINVYLWSVEGFMTLKK